jgi:hypothetical protein
MRLVVVLADNLRLDILSTFQAKGCLPIENQFDQTIAIYLSPSPHSVSQNVFTTVQQMDARHFPLPAPRFALVFHHVQSRRPV